MPITINIQENPFLREIFEEGQQEGRPEEAAVLLRRLLERRFGPLPSWAQQQLAAADIFTVPTAVPAHPCFRRTSSRGAAQGKGLISISAGSSTRGPRPLGQK